MNTQHNQQPESRPAANQQAKGNDNSAPSEQDLWDAAFSSDDPTVVLTAEDLQQAASRRAESRTTDGEATRAFPSPIPAPSPQDDADASEDGESAFGWLNAAGSGNSGSSGGGASAGSAPAPSTAAAPSVSEHRGAQTPTDRGTAPGVTPQNTAPRAPEQPQRGDFAIPSPAGQPAQPVIQPGGPVLTAATALQMQKERYSRMHVLPGLLGWLVAITLMDGGRWGIGAWLTSTGQEQSLEYHAVIGRLLSGESSVIPVAVALSVLVFVAYLVGGYAAGRMARFAGSKQGIAVWLWHLMGLIVASLATYLVPQVFPNGTAAFSMQRLMNGDTSNGLLAIMLILALSFLGALIGGACGQIYHRRVDKYPSTRVEREDD